ncbi:MAG: OmpA family protein [Fibrobacteres bacterium]|nr:OmpA family protein [Fibrobacterota bacterium]
MNFGALFAGNAKSDNIFVLSSSLEWTPHELVTLFTDFYGQARFTQLAASFDLGKEPLILGSGACINIPGGAHLTLAFDKCFSFNDKYKTIYYNPEKKQAYQTKIFPDIGISAGLSWNGSILGSDRDRDGIADKQDACPDEPEDVDGYEDYDGCPDYDNDRDGILDIRDKCPNEAEDFDGFEDQDGCPELDNDRDGIADVSDKCPNEPEDKDKFEDQDGCPESDNDQDGIQDASDRCSSEPEDLDGFEDTDGCPEFDNDKDGLADAKDKCPNLPETVNKFQDEDGCPDEKIAEVPPKIVLEGVNFKTGSAELTYESFAILDKQIASLIAYPDVCIEISGHTDNVGKRESNLTLSQDRAASVRTYMVSKGVPENRIIAVGKGPDEPIGDNRKADERAKNRRIEMYRIPCK